MVAELVRAGGTYGPGYVNRVLSSAWPQLYAPQRAFEVDVLVALFRHAGYVTDGPRRPDCVLTVYRGEPDGLAELGMAWTTHRATAVEFMERHAAAGPAVTWQAQAGPDSVLARFAAEDEVVVQPDLLIGIVRIAELAHTGVSWPS